MAEVLISSRIIGVLLTGFLPPILWLLFWLHEDIHPEPKRKILVSFILGMLAVPLALFLEFVWYKLALLSPWPIDISVSSLALIIPFAFIEEIIKFMTAWREDLRKNPYYDEPVDAMIYLITVALGFSAIENVIFLFHMLESGVYAAIVTASLRFFGATLLHTVTAGIMGASIALAFFHKERQNRNIIGGILAATALHAAFNAFIINSESPLMIFRAFFLIWTLIVILIFAFEKIKKIHS